MRLNTRVWGSGPQTAVLVHGMMSDSTAWSQVGPHLARRGYRVYAVDLPGHGLSPRDPNATMDSVADALLESVPHQPDLLIAHSMGSYICAQAADRLRPAAAIYLDTPVGASHRVDRDVLIGHFSQAQAKRTLENLTRKHLDWDRRDHLSEANAARTFDPATTASVLASAAGHDYTPHVTIPTMMIHAEPSRYLSPEHLRRLTSLGWTVRSIPKADHLLWYGHLHEFLTLVDEFTPHPRWTKRLIPTLRATLTRAS